MNTTEQKLEIAINALTELANRGVNSSNYNHRAAQLAIVDSTPDEALIYFSGYVEQLDAAIKTAARDALDLINSDRVKSKAPELPEPNIVLLSDILDEFANAVISGDNNKAKKLFARISRHVGSIEMQALDDLWHRVASFGHALDNDFLYQVNIIKKQHRGVTFAYNEMILR